MIRSNQAGFTVLELLVATSIFAVILLLVTVGMIKINSNYYKGVNSANTQNTARSVMDSIAQNIQFGDTGSVNPIALASYPVSNLNAYSICIVKVRYSVQLGYKLDDSVANDHAVVKDTSAGCAPGTQTTNFTGGGALNSGAVEMLSPNMRIAKLTVVQVAGTTNLYTIHIRLVYGDDDLLSDDLDSSGNPGTDGILDSCKTTAGSQFCAVSDLTTTVEKRIL